MTLWKQLNQEGSDERANDKAPPVLLVSTSTPNPSTLTSMPSPTLRESPVKEHRESVFGPGVNIEGKIEGDANLRIAGKFKGDIYLKGDLTIEKGASVAAKINVANVTIGGAVDGNIIAVAQVKLLEGGQLTGDLKAATLTVAAGSRMRGHVEFGWSASDAAKFANGPARESDNLIKER
jgi:cytoskeletal protein CcmA (bactofilin family)